MSLNTGRHHGGLVSLLSFLKQADKLLEIYYAISLNKPNSPNTRNDKTDNYGDAWQELLITQLFKFKSVYSWH
jgi:hypothetical protein